jgi:carbonic anhydrase
MPPAAITLPMSDLNHLLANNREWSEAMRAKEPDFFTKLQNVQSPEYLWIGCSDSRVPANQITGLLPGEVFVHRNVANVVTHTDLNCLSVMQYAVEVLRVRHILVVGHYGCGGVLAALTNRRMGLIDNWLRHIQDVRNKHAMLLEEFDENDRHDRLCELNVIEQVSNVGETTIVRHAWERGQDLTVHGWVYRLENGIIRDLKVSIASSDEVASNKSKALAALKNPT